MDVCLSDDDIVGHFAGELPPERAGLTERHLASCSSCAERAARLAEQQDRLLSRVRVVARGSSSAAAYDVNATQTLGSSGAVSAHVLPSAAHVHPERVGSYRILRVIGQGGMGTVYEAEQERPRRTVALKVIRPGYASGEMLKRFEVESQVLGRLQHPGIAQIFEAGTADAGYGPQPYFAMEYIRGLPLKPFTDEHKLSVRERLELVAKIADAVQHAHQKGVIHRDLKPANILVVVEGSGIAVQASGTDPPLPPLSKGGNGGVGQPKVLDFGVARAIDSDLQATTVQTDIGVLIGTLPYMSPEQVSGDPAQLDTRTDVYSLGVILYELLAGKLPYAVDKRTIPEAVRVIREEEPSRLSSISRALRGDIETIVGKSLEKDKDRRYQTAAALAADIRRYLNDEPIAARPPSTWYQTRKFATRNKAVVAGVTATFLMLIAGIVGTGLALNRALAAEAEQGKQRERAHERAAEAERQTAIAQAARKDADERADETKEVAEFQAQMLAGVDPTEAGRLLAMDIVSKFDASLANEGLDGIQRIHRVESLRADLGRVNATDTARELLDATILRHAVDAVDRQFKEQPLVDARLRQTLASVYRRLGLYDTARAQEELALNIRRLLLGEEHPDTLASINNMGVLLREQGTLTEAEPYFLEALEKRRRVLGDEHPDTLTSINNLGVLLDAQGKLTEAEPYYREALEKRRRLLGDDHPDVLNSINNMGALLDAQGKLTEAEPYYRAALEKRRRLLGEEHPNTLTSINNLGFLLRAQGKVTEAEPYYREALDKRRRLLGEEHPDTLASINNMGSLLRVQGKLTEAEPYYREALEKHRLLLGEEHPDTLNSIHGMGLLLQVQGKLAEAEPYCREALRVRRRLLGDEHADTLISINEMGVMLQRQGKLMEAESYCRESLEKRRRLLGDEHPDTLQSLNNIGSLLQQQGKLPEAEPYCREALEKRRGLLGDEHPDTLISMNMMAFLLQAQGKLAEAEPYYREALEQQRRLLGNEHPDTLISINNMGTVLQAQGKLTEAEPYYHEALGKRRRMLGDEHPNTLNSMNNMGKLLEAQGKLAEAEPYLREALEKRRRLLGDEHPDTLGSMNNLGIVLQHQGRSAEAETVFRQAVEIALAAREQHPPSVALCLHHLGDILRERQAYAEAEGLVLRALAVYRAHLEWNPGEYAHAASILAAIYQETERVAEAAEVLGEKVALDRRRLPAGSAQLAALLALRASNLLKIDAFETAEELLRECLAIRERLIPDGHAQAWLRYNAASMLGEAIAGRVADRSRGDRTSEEADVRLREAEGLLLDAWAKLKGDPRVPSPIPEADRKREALERVFLLYDAWHAVEPEKGYDAQAAEWRAKLIEWQASTQPAAAETTATQPANSDAASSPPAEKE